MIYLDDLIYSCRYIKTDCRFFKQHFIKIFRGKILLTSFLSNANTEENFECYIKSFKITY